MLVSTFSTLLETPPLVDLGVQRQAFHHKTHQKSDARDTDHHSPDDRNRIRERHPHFRPQWFFKGRDHGNDAVGNGNALRELLHKCRREALCQLSLEDGSTDGYAPDLRGR